MWRTTSEEQIQDQDNQPKETEMFTTIDTMQAETDYRRDRIARDFRRSTHTARPRGRGEPAARRGRLLHLRHA